MSDPVQVAQQIADETLFPNALETDRSRDVPVEMLNRLADADLFGLQSAGVEGRPEVGRSTTLGVLEALSSGCLTTAFVWAQHGGAARASAQNTGPVHERWASALASGQKRGGVAFAYLLRPGTPMMSATPVEGGWRFSGHAPFVTGWGHIDALLIAGRHGADIVWAIIDAAESPTMTAKRLELAAVNASVTVGLTVDNHFIGDDEVASIQPFDQWLDGYSHRLRDNGSLALGVTRRVLSLLGPTNLDDELATCRSTMDSIYRDYPQINQPGEDHRVEQMTSARAATTALGVRASAALIASVGGAALSIEHHGQRLGREALFLLIQGQTQAIQSEHIRLFAR